MYVFSLLLLLPRSRLALSFAPCPDYHKYRARWCCIGCTFCSLSLSPCASTVAEIGVEKSSHVCVACMYIRTLLDSVNLPGGGASAVLMVGGGLHVLCLTFEYRKNFSQSRRDAYLSNYELRSAQGNRSKRRQPGTMGKACHWQWWFKRSWTADGETGSKFLDHLMRLFPPPLFPYIFEKMLGTL